MPDRLSDAQRRLNAARDRERRRTMGPPLSQDDDALDALASVGPSDFGSIEAFVRDVAGQAGVDMLNAEAEDA